LSGWQWLKLGAVITLKRGYDIRAVDRKEGLVPVVASSGIVGYHNEAKVPAPGVVTGRYGTIGNVFFITEPFWPSNTTLYVEDFKGNDPHFVFYLLQRIDFRRYSDKTGVPGINRNDVHTAHVSLPPLPEQRAIAAILETWDRAIALTERRLAAAEQRKKALMQQLLTGRVRFPEFAGEEWQEVRLKDVARINPPKLGNIKDDISVSFIAMADVSENARIINTTERPYCEVNSGFTSFQNEDILVAKITPCFENGKGAWVHNIKNGLGFGSTEFHVIRVHKTKADPEYIYYHTITHSFRGRGATNMVGSAGQKRIRTDFIQNYRIMLPPLPEQRRIAAVLNTCDRELDLLRRKRDALQRQKKGLMQRLLTGRVRVRGVEAAQRQEEAL